MKKTWLLYALISIMLGTVSCSKDNDDDKNETIEKEDILGTWTASSGKYNLWLEITSTGYSFRLSEPGNGGIIDNGTYEISDEGKIAFVNKSNPLCIAQLQNGKLNVTFVGAIMISMLGTAAASNTTFTLEEKEEEVESYGFLVLQNNSSSNNMVNAAFYDDKGEFLDSDSDTLEPGYQFTYEVETGSYKVTITDSKGKSFTSKVFKVVKDKTTVLGYTGSSLDVLATGINNSELSKSTINNMKRLRFNLVNHNQ